LKEIYEKIEKERGKVSNIMRVHSLNPIAMEKHMDFYLAIMFSCSGLKREEKELIAVAVSIANKCQYCINHHAEALNHYWKDDKKIQNLIKNFKMPDLPERAKRMLEYVTKLTKKPDEINESDIHGLRKVGFSDEDILNINLITSYFNFVNRVVLGLGVEFTEDEIKGYRY